LYTSGFSQKNLACGAICFISFACGAIFSSKNLEAVCLRLSVPLSKIGTRTGASLSNIRKDRN